MDTREVLRPYKKQRLGFEGVLVDVMEPNRRNGHTYGLVFGSIYAPNENIELDHAVIQMDIADFKKAKLNLYTRYYFTAEITSYYKATNIMGVIAQRENFMLQNISILKLREMPDSNITQPTMYVMKRIHNIMLCKGKLRHTEEELIKTVFHTPNDGSVERFINECTGSYQQVSMNKHNMEEILYT
ncbi:hypothetical protein JUJ52_03150 [Virgibacillus sp. AGTR]|uniref:hypothetical protein n=1 Tax=Virgibacillus sp. AGTR TaxID=2812055 RepID=UPI001D16A83D|nr:hypothetical protein [Virgibacillus sp. AGTR]MCC2248955.1 hypothetical protein [Virgibacillus sp. AGTR]